MTIPLLLATTNKKKLQEIRELLAGFPVRLLSLADLPVYEEVPETGKTFKENATLKALGYARQSSCLTLAEDSGLSCDALEGAPGIYSARFAGEPYNDEANNAKLLKLLEKIPDNCRGAHYTSAIALALPLTPTLSQRERVKSQASSFPSPPERGRGQGEGVIGTVEGEVHGVIARELKGNQGFGYDPLFFYPPYQKTFGEVNADMKHRVSHRAKAFQKSAQLLKEFLSEKSGGKKQ